MTDIFTFLEDIEEEELASVAPSPFSGSARRPSS